MGGRGAARVVVECAAMIRHPARALVPALLALLATASPPLAAADREAPREVALPSGMRLLLVPRAGSATILTAVAVQAGAQDEPAGKAGMSHFLEHLLFDGFDALDERGVTEAIERRSTYLNAFTRDQATVYFALAPREEAPAVAALLTGMISRSAILPALVDKERKVILEELAKDAANPNSRQEEALRSALWAGTPWERPVGGFPDTVKAAGTEDVRGFWRRHYRPSRLRVLVLGDAPTAELERVAAPLAALQEPKDEPAPAPRAALLDGKGWGEWRAAAGAGEEPKLALSVAPPSGSAIAGPALDLVARWLGDDQGPLHAALVPALAKSVSADRVALDPQDALTVRVEALAGKDAPAVAGALLAALDRAAEEGPSDAEVARLSRAAAAQRAVEGQRLHYAAVLYGDAFATARGPLVEAIEPAAVDGASVRAAAKALLAGARARSRAAWGGPGGPAAPGPLPAAAASPQAGKASAAAPGPNGSRVITLRNGLVVGVLEEPGSAVFGLHLLVADRSLREPEGQAGVADLAHRLLAEGSRLSPGERLARRLSRAGIEAKTADNPSIPFDDEDNVPEYGYLRLEGPAAGLGDGMVLLAEMLRQPEWDATGFERALSAHKKERKAMGQGGAAAAIALRARLVGAASPLARPVPGRGDAKLPDDAQVRAFLAGAWPAGYFAPSRLLVTVAGPVTAEQVASALDDLLGGGPDGAPQRGPYPPPAPEKDAAPSPEVEGGPPQVNLGWGRLAEVPEAERAALVVALAALSDRMVAIIREKEGLAYGLGAGARALPGGAWLLSANVGTRSPNRARVRELFGELVQRLRSDELPAADLQRLVSRARQKEMLSRLAAGVRAARLGRLLFEGPGSPLLQGYAAQSKVTPAQVKAAAKRWLDPKGLAAIESR